MGGTVAMPEGQEVLSKPRIIVAEDASVAAKRYILGIDRNIHRNPEAFASSLQQLGESAISELVDFEAINDDDISKKRQLSQGPDADITDYFKFNFDYYKFSDLDDRTEDIIAADPRHKQLVARDQSIKSENEKINKKNLVRRERLGTYIRTVLEYNDQQQQLTQESRATLRHA
jgi:hypothetical protein